MFAVFFRGLIAVVVSMLLMTQAMAAQVSGLFESERLVVDQSPEARAAEVARGLAEVLVKVSGHEDTLQSEPIQAMLGQAEQYLAQFSYQDNPLAEVELGSEGEVASDSGQAGRSSQTGNAGQEGASANENVDDSAPLPKRYRLIMQFDSASVMQVLNQAQQAVWGSNRPSVLIWLAVEGSNRRFIVNSDNNPLLTELLESSAERRGVPITLPLMDLKDEQVITVSDIWGQFGDRIAAASVRYSADATYTGRFYKDGEGQWQGHWLLQVGKERKAIALNNARLGGLFRESVDVLAEELANKYAVVNKPGKSGEYRFAVKGVESVEGYARLNRYLNSLQVVERVEVTRLDDASIGYKVVLKGDSDQFLSVLKLDSFLRLDESSMVNSEVDFFWQGQR